MENVPSISHGNEWEVVSLTASAYATISAGTVDSTEKNKDKEFRGLDPAITLFMSDHFIFPPCEHENLPLIESHDVSEPGSQLNSTAVGAIYDDKEPFNAKSSEHDELPTIEYFDKGKKIWVPEVEFNVKALDDENMVETTDHCDSAADMSEAAILSDSSDGTEHECISPENVDLTKISKLLNSRKTDNHVSPYESWWRKQVASLYTHAKDANKLWSVFVAAALMGILILGQQWQWERWQIQQLKWNLSSHDKIVHRVLGPVSRFKDVVIGTHRRGLGGISSIND